MTRNLRILAYYKSMTKNFVHKKRVEFSPPQERHTSTLESCVMSFKTHPQPPPQGRGALSLQRLFWIATPFLRKRLAMTKSPKVCHYNPTAKAALHTEMRRWLGRVRKHHFEPKCLISSSLHSHLQSPNPL